ncbi:MAG TPA: excalibur calcium-binding domain-containing protein [Streptomyces sp.]|nr:excalibur calcium-binding domain-containing protein [Streptomyces sp.]
MTAPVVPEPAVTVTKTRPRTEKATPAPAVTVTEAPETTPATKPDPPRAPVREPVPERQPDAYYENCDEARAAGVAPLHQGDPGYSSDLDRDGDGVACEPYSGR